MLTKGFNLKDIIEDIGNMLSLGLWTEACI